ncbi:polygalacturonase [Tripterygium wilfordii]|uniref:endo-polygalacturonase n=1 Tax=Tripterygium wilfordii TaxID=458696 RepID=A0A7J7D6M7_TRIWF|nr:probable polygalacturonase At1g80170 [Tripterygium wilfordii]XP_038713680.1 probable polygalacturonase At1g80170 [Tripterygium wilfordii]XP_038713681.1 probable polygalacturonase At1g80170 [Tripterygium wilfordii]KAF5741726.1 polygalacturonase [Tripterygium wilfordii]
MRNLGSCSCSMRIVLLSCTYVLICCITVHVEGFDSLLQLPQSGLPITRIRSKRVLHLGDFGGKGDGIHNDTGAFKHAWDIACSFPLRTQIVIPFGYTFLIYPTDISGPCKSKVTLRVSGTIVAPKDPDAWNGLNPRKWLYFHGVNHLTMEGGGKINGMGQKWWARSCKINATNPCRRAPTAITFHRCKNLKVDNLMLVNSQKMHIAFTNCVRLKVSRLKVIAPAASPNTDGIHISSSRGVEVKDSIVRTGDDCISIVGNSSQIKIRNFACGPGHGISIGSLGKSNSTSCVHDVMVDQVFLSNTDNGVRIKTWQGGSGNVTKIQFQNVLMENVSNPVIIDQYYCDSPLPCVNQTTAVKVENISFVHIKGTSATEDAIRFACSDSLPCEGLYLEDIQLASSSSTVAKSFCWEAHGSSLGPMYPPPCFCNDSIIKLNVLSDATLQSL